MSVPTEFEHFVVTRFNVAVGFGNGQHLRDEWLRYRVGLFLRYCVPSVAAQTTQSFRWLVLIDPASPAWLRTELAAAHSSIEIVDCPDGSVVSALRTALRRIEPRGSCLVTTRLDSDDAIDSTYLERVQRTVGDRLPLFAVFPEGYTYNPDSGVLRRYTHQRSPFISLIERWTSSPKTVYATNHTKVQGPITIASPEPAWLQVIHGSNVSNDERGRSVRSNVDELLRERFAVGSAHGGTELDRLAFVHGTDKGTRHTGRLVPKGYTMHYARLLESRRDEALVLLEIGAGGGGSLRMWADYLPNARLYAIDVDASSKAHETDRVTVFVGDQADRAFLQRVIAEIGTPIDVIIDDGGHHMHQHQASFETLFPRLAPSGWYAIEDLQTAYQPRFGGGYRAPASTIEYLKSLVDTINGHADGRPSAVLNVGSLHFFERLAIICGERASEHPMTT